LQAQLTTQLLQAAFGHVPSLAHLVLVVHKELDARAHPALAACCELVMRSGGGSSSSNSGSSVWMYAANRRTILPALRVGSNARSLLSSAGQG
jgi:hypothetical protein